MSSALTLLGDAVSAAVAEALDGTGLRHGHGYVIQRLLTGPSTATEIADELGVTQQAVSKTVRELLALGHLETVTDPVDGRRRPVRLTQAGFEAVEKARAARREVDGRIRAVLGPEVFEATLAGLVAAFEALGMADRVRRRAVPPPTPDLRDVNR